MKYELCTYLEPADLFTKTSYFKPYFLAFIFRNGKVKANINKCKHEENEKGNNQHQRFAHHLHPGKQVTSYSNAKIL